ncbi:MAG: hypothetical protein DMG21_11470 [Acidobacteria bacterium]|nr:MAG: hypothetical protein DMG21_11470 [Acidobacteriota bacterium]
MAPIIYRCRTERKGCDESSIGVIFQTWALQAAVIPAKAGIQSVHNAFPKTWEVDSRIRGNDGGFERDRIPNDTSIMKPAGSLRPQGGRSGTRSLDFARDGELVEPPPAPTRARR